MKMIIGIIFLLLSNLSLPMACKDADEIIYYPNILLNRKCYWFDRVEEFKKSNEHASVVFIGDSIVQSGNWNEILNSNDVANRGIGGDTTALILERMDTIYSVNPSTAYIMVGINDFCRSASVNKVFRYYEVIINDLLKNNINVIVLSTLHCNSKMNLSVCREVNAKITSLNNKLSNKNNIRFIDINKYLSEKEELKSIYTTDGIHLNKDGYFVIGRIIA